MKKIFLSYAYEDRNYATLLKGQLANHRTSLQILDLDLINSNSVSVIRDAITKLINQSSMVITFVPNYSTWSEFEVSHAKKIGIPILGVSISKEELYRTNINYNYPIIEWTYDSLLNALLPNGKSFEYKQKNIEQITPIIKVDFNKVSFELNRYILQNPNDLYKLSPRKFEEFVAFLFDKMGYEVTLTQSTRDGGKDIYALKREDIGNILTIIECKKYNQNRPVGVDIVRGIYGVLNIEKASHAMIATTSHFTSGAFDLQRELQYQISLKDHVDITNWMQKVEQKK